MATEPSWPTIPLVITSWSQSPLVIGAPARHCTRSTCDDQTKPDACTSTDWASDSRPSGAIDAVGGGARGPSGAKDNGTWATMPSPSVVTVRVQPSPVRQSTGSPPDQPRQIRALARTARVAVPEASAVV